MLYVLRNRDSGTIGVAQTTERRLPAGDLLRKWQTSGSKTNVISGWRVGEGERREEGEGIISGRKEAERSGSSQVQCHGWRRAGRSGRHGLGTPPPAAPLPPGQSTRTAAMQQSHITIYCSNYILIQLTVLIKVKFCFFINAKL